jgi:hypothetical protein
MALFVAFSAVASTPSCISNSFTSNDVINADEPQSIKDIRTIEAIITKRNQMADCRVHGVKLINFKTIGGQNVE